MVLQREKTASVTVIKAIYEAIGNMGFETGNILEPSMGVGNFFGCLPAAMQNSKLYGIELDSITGRIAKQLYFFLKLFDVSRKPYIRNLSSHNFYD